MENQLQRLVAGGFVRPTTLDWEVRFTFVDGSTKVIRVSPGRVSEERAIKLAKRSMKLIDESILERIETGRAGDDRLVIAPPSEKGPKEE